MQINRSESSAQQDRLFLRLLALSQLGRLDALEAGPRSMLLLLPRRCCRPASRRVRRLLSSWWSSSSSSWVPPPMPTEGVHESFGPLFASALDADAHGRSQAALEDARAALEVAASRSQTGSGREQALRLAHHLTGVSLLKLGRVSEAARALDMARQVAIRASSAGLGCDAYTDVGGVLVDLGVALALLGDVQGAQKHLSRSLFMAGEFV